MTRAAPLLFLAACGNVTVGEQGNFEFQDLTVTADEGLFEGRDGLDLPLATGASMTVQVRKSGFGAVSLVGASTEDGGVLEVVSADGDEVVVRGVAPGTTKLLVQGQELEDSVEVDVADAARADLLPVRDGTLFQRFAPIGIDSAGYALRPAARFGLAAVLYADDETPLTGAAPVAWTFTEGVFEAEAYTRLANGAWLERVGGAGAQTVGVTLGDAALGSFDLTLLTANDPVSLRIYAADMATITPLDTLDVEAGTVLFGLLGFDAGNRVVIPGAAEEPTIEVLEGPANLITSPDYAPELFGLSVAACPGTGRIRVNFMGGAAEYTVAVTGEAPATCGAQ